ncbi:LPXTG cell wall anchor domain-containing protein [Streptococcus koreensis]|uniref:LPXTG cell wall anchor domain-containing protein n=1 Tax=Streptococcus koreensis TaxID=2382163 RepID=UPI003CEA2EF7
MSLLRRRNKLSTTPEKPVEPKPQEPKKVLPHTGETASMALMLGGISVGLVGLGFAKRKELQ